MHLIPDQQLTERLPNPATPLEQNVAVAIVLWVMLAGVLVVVANAWAMGAL